MIFKLAEAAEKSWRRLDGHNQLPKIILGVKFTDGIEIVRSQAGLSIDIDEAKKAEASLQTVQAELARVSRLTTLGQITASIAHEVTQPIASSLNNACAALNFLDQHPSDLSEVKEALECVVADANRAGAIVERIRDQIKKAHPRKGSF
jgi:C4-dicarboxylate-specific signal transduction histidine kinase